MNNSEQSFAKPNPECASILSRYFERRSDGVDFPESVLETSIPDRFASIVRRFPDRTAVKIGDRSLTYDELNRSAARIARSILRQRAEGNEPVALLLKQEMEIFPAILGILMAGKFYLALDPTSPPERLAYILQDSGAAIVVTNCAGRELALSLDLGDRTLLNIDEIDNTATWDALPSHIEPEDFAALNYTSGSQGLPKGLVESHRFILHTTRVLTHLKRITPRDRLTLFHFVGFAAAEAHFLPSLLNGACLCPFDIKTDGVQQLRSWLDTEGITLGHMPVSAFRNLAEIMPTGTTFASLRLLQLSGAPISRSDFDLYRTKFSPATSLQILMGTTETGAVATGIIGHSFSFPEKGTPIGYPWPNTQIRLFDDEDREVAPGEIGEITIRSRYMSAGYWRKETLNQVRFSSDPGDEEQTYRTGDLGRMMPDGLFVHMGRKDLLVKIRGYRVEIGETERALLNHPMLQDVAVRAWDWQSGEKYLAAYLVLREQATLTVSDMVEFLRSRLPDYMIPNAFVFLNSLPLTNGKLDRKSLPKPERVRPALDHPYVAPRNDLESAICRIWEEMLDLQTIGIDDKFFDLGGHSLLAAQLFTRLDDEFDRLLPLSVLVDSPTIRLLANHFRSAAEPDKISALVPFTQAGDQPAVFAVPGVYGNVVGLFDLCRELGKDRPFYGLQSIGLDGKERAIDSIEAMAERYLTEVRSVQPHGPYILIGACFGAQVTCEMAYQLLEADEEISFLGFLDPIGLVLKQRLRHFETKSPSKNKQPSNFLTSRMQLYFKEMRDLNNYERAKFLARKITSLGRTLTNKKARGAVQREIHQLAVFNASKIAGRDYQPKTLKGRLKALEIFVSEHPRKIELENFDWATLWDGRPELHQVPGRDSGDMLSGENAKVLGALLHERLSRPLGGKHK